MAMPETAPAAASEARLEGSSDVVARILDGAGRAFVEHGVSGAGMREIAACAGCSRATLYRHFENRHALHVAFAEDRAARLGAELNRELETVRDPAEHLTEYILRAVAKVRSDPSMVAWFAPSEAGVAARMSRGSEVIAHLGGAFTAEWVDGDQRPETALLRARFIVRQIVSLLTTPGESEAEERALVTRFVVPAVLGAADR